MKLVIHKQVEAHIDALMQRPYGTVLLCGPAGVGKATMAGEVGRRLVCAGCSDASCSACKLVAAGSHPDVVWLEPDDKGTIGVEAVHRLHHRLIHRPYQQGVRRVAIIRDADGLSLPAQNALLKLLEEPPVDTLIIVTASDQTVLLDTVLSRCRSIYLPPLPTDAVAQAVTERAAIGSTEAQLIAELSGGAVGVALQLAADPEVLQRQQQLHEEASELSRGNQFDRLQTAARLATNSANLPEYVRYLGLQAHERLRRQDAGSTLPQPLEAVQRLQQRLKANVAPRAALEAYVMEAAV